MDIKIIINSLFIILILHIILLNIGYSINIGKKIESFDNQNNSMNFLTNNNDSNDDFKSKLLKYIDQDEKVPYNEFEDKNLNKVQASNSFLNDNNEPNFESNVADISKFYNINYDSLDENQLKSTSIETLNKITEVKTKECPTESYVRKPEINPDTWNYKNELPMNGGNINGIVGFDNLESQFASYNPNKLNLQSIDENKFNNIPYDDLRKPIVYED
jgi:hypothetical protein